MLELGLRSSYKLEKKIDNVGVAFEDLRKDFKAVAEGHSLLDRKIDRLDKKDAKLNEHEVILKRMK